MNVSTHLKLTIQTIKHPLDKVFRFTESICLILPNTSHKYFQLHWSYLWDFAHSKKAKAAGQHTQEGSSTHVSPCPHMACLSYIRFAHMCNCEQWPERGVIYNNTAKPEKGKKRDRAQYIK